MADDALLQMQQQHSQGQRKYTYFLLAVTASAMAFAIARTDELTITWSLLPLGVAVLLWGLSFYFGVKQLDWAQAALYANHSLLQLAKGVHPEQPPDPSLTQVAAKVVRSAIEENVDKAQFYGQGQFGLLIAGGIFYLIWHILEMALRT